VSNQFDQIRALLNEVASVVVLSHVRPDGDAIGSMLALTLSLEGLGKRVVPLLFDGVPERFRFLPAAERVSQEIPDEFDLLIAVDCGDIRRTGLPPDFPRQPDINIDHHPTNTHFATTNLVDPSASATAEMIYDLLAHVSIPITEDVATNLLAGLVTDTVGFRTDSVTPKVMRMAADLMERGAKLHEIYFQGLDERPLVETRYWEKGLAKLQSTAGIVWTSLTIEDRESTGYLGEDDADLINLLSRVAGAKVAVIFIEQPEGKIKVSWRSREGLDVSNVARIFGGGGHKPAAGAMIQGDRTEVERRVLSATQDLIQRTPDMEKR
jgi:phosphoesterase RecJ-like protein